LGTSIDHDVTADQAILIMIRCEKMYNAIEMITTILKHLAKREKMLEKVTNDLGEIDYSQIDENVHN